MAQVPPDTSDQPDEAGDSGTSGRGPVDPRGANQAPSPPPGYQPVAMMPAAPQRSVWGRLGASVLTTILLLSIGVNVYLGIIVAAYTGGGPRESVYEEGDTSHRIVVLPIEEMVTGATAAFVRRSLRLLEDDPPAAVVLRIDCPGGTVSASDQIWHEINRFKQKTDVPIIASFGSVAASGGYYIAAPADLIVAEPTTITGSIGVIVMGFTIDELLDKIGVTPEIVVSKHSTRKDELLPVRPWTEEEREILRDTRLEPAWERFVHVVHQGRSHLLDEAQVRELATGEVFAAEQARELKLVDEIGYLEDAVAFAREQADLPSGVQPQIMIIRQPSGFGLLSLMATSSGDLNAMKQMQQLRDLSPEQLRSWVLEMAAPRAMYNSPIR
ncbi:MAG: signal peptide peptidase SppA [Phycisphaeraceae bacterium]